MRRIIIHSSHPVVFTTVCEADENMYGDTVKCGESSVMVVTVDGLTRYVCQRHLDYLREVKGTQKE